MRLHNVSPVTVSRALGRLAAEGRVITKPGSGAYVAPPVMRAGDTVDMSWQTVALGDRMVDDTGVSGLLTPRLTASSRSPAAISTRPCVPPGPSPPPPPARSAAPTSGSYLR